MEKKRKKIRASEHVLFRSVSDSHPLLYVPHNNIRKFLFSAAGSYPQKLPQRGCGTPKKRGTSFPVPLKKRSIVCGLSLLKDVLAHSTDGADPAFRDQTFTGLLFSFLHYSTCRC
mgnify:CR=1 FL=1